MTLKVTADGKVIRDPERKARLEKAIENIGEEICDFIDHNWEKAHGGPLEPDWRSEFHVAICEVFSRMTHLYDDDIDLTEMTQPPPEGDPELLP